MSFSAQLREATWPHHKRAERTAYLRALVTGRVDRLGYAEMVAQHYFAYVVLEEAGDAMRRDPVAGPFAADELLRVPALERDLAALLGPQWRDSIAPNEATRTYCERMREVCFTWPFAFVAHHYTRYLGDLSGGQYLARAVESRLGVDKQNGTAFYDFSALGDLEAFRHAYREQLDATPWSEQERSWFIAEAAFAYDINTAVLDQLAGHAQPETASAAA